MDYPILSHPSSRCRISYFPFVKNIHDGEKTLFSQHMKDAVFIIPKPSLLQEAVAILDDLNITAQNRDTQGDIYEYRRQERSVQDAKARYRDDGGAC